ncbi:MAG: hypothetical protein AAGA48_09340 [Myxococcota bacterium]
MIPTSSSRPAHIAALRDALREADATLLDEDATEKRNGWAHLLERLDPPPRDLSQTVAESPDDEAAWARWIQGPIRPCHDPDWWDALLATCERPWSRRRLLEGQDPLPAYELRARFRDWNPSKVEAWFDGAPRRRAEARITLTLPPSMLVEDAPWWLARLQHRHAVRRAPTTGRTAREAGRRSGHFDPHAAAEVIFASDALEEAHSEVAELGYFSEWWRIRPDRAAAWWLSQPLESLHLRAGLRGLMRVATWPPDAWAWVRKVLVATLPGINSLALALWAKQATPHDEADVAHQYTHPVEGPDARLAWLLVDRSEEAFDAFWPHRTRAPYVRGRAQAIQLAVAFDPERSAQLLAETLATLPKTSLLPADLAHASRAVWRAWPDSRGRLLEAAWTWGPALVPASV